MFLFINTAEENKTQAVLFEIKNGDEIEILSKISSRAKSDKALILIDKILKKNKLTPRNLKGVFVIKGPGPFTAIRIAIALANTFSYALQIPVFGIKFEEHKTIEELIKNKIKRIKNISPNKIVKPIESV